MQPSDITRLSRNRPYREYGNPTQTKIVNNREYEWSDNVYGLLGTIDNGTKNFYIAVDDRNRLQKTPFVNNTFGTPSIVPGTGGGLFNFSKPKRSYPAPNYCPDGFFGQGSKADTGFYIPIKSCVGGTYIQYRNDSGSMGATAGLLQGRSINWIAIDPISKFFFVQSTDNSTLSSVSVYDWTPTPYNSRTSTNILPRLITNVILTDPNRIISNGIGYITISNVTAACFSSNGIFHVLCDDNGSTSGVYSFKYEYNRFILRRFIHIAKNSESRLSFGTDKQSLVGITCFLSNQNTQSNNLYVLYLDNDVATTDNVSLIEIQGVH